MMRDLLLIANYLINKINFNKLCLRYDCPMGVVLYFDIVIRYVFFKFEAIINRYWITH